ncbi:MAG: hypothetical protein A2945_00560 [Candidatus Liptonbacteria bacterium RIFCSPLOWO2_01_FULL_52_25]|uniref:RNA polymerase sigma-70 region 2 domain-containing protein n=1 Tax=Candidatus Liptonbacteria bacterium RIFCSPLOWO2_01_FULL_52_25 TaxID=1798650 RepID=A0A1G2CF22_9BACT|nr:MAG: hypothetical protein A2945_00560 [Candidatus Liptonbacteria bacterium RIFCSPLOWO2_01_FULL_52_25]
MPKAKTTNTDRELIANALNGDESAYTALYKRHRGKVFALILRVFRNREDAQDATQDTFLRAFKRIRTFRGESAFSSWLCSVGINETLKELKKRRAKSRTGYVIPIEELYSASLGNESVVVQPNRSANSLTFESHDRADIGAPESFSKAITTNDFVEKLLAQLKKTAPGYHAVIVGKCLHDLEHQEIAARNKCSIGNSKSQNHKGLRTLLLFTAQIMGIRIKFGNAKIGDIRKVLKPLIERRIMAH